MDSKFKLTKLERNWIFYDVANSAFTLMVSTLIPIFFNSLAESEGVSSVDYLAYWGYSISLSTLAVAIMGPILGGICDRRGRKKPVFMGVIALGAACCLAMGLAKSWVAFLVIFIIARIGYQLSLVIYDSMLGDVTSEERMDSVSSSGYAWGYIGSCAPFIVCLVLVLQAGKIGMTQGQAMTIAFIIVALWWVLMSMPLLRSYKQVHFLEGAAHEENLFATLGHTLKEMIRDKQILFFLLAFFFYIDGVYTIIDMSTAYGTALGLNSTDLLLALLVTQFVAFPSALIMGRLSRKLPSERLITVCITAYFCIACFAFFLASEWQFWVLAIGVGMFQGGIQALSRSYFTKIIPAEKSGEYFGFLDICGKGASIMGTTVMSMVSQLTGHLNYGVASIAIFFVFGMLFFRMSVSSGKK
jgi:UMF1 family MFS transporter